MTLWRFALPLGVLAACSNSPDKGSDASVDAPSGADVAQEAAVVTCTTPGAKCPSGGSCFFAVGDCTATTGICADDSFCAGASTETVCHCDGTETPEPQCGPGGYVLAQAANFGPCVASDAGSDASDAGAD